MGNAGIDDGQEVLAHHLPDVDARGRSTKIERRHLELVGLGNRDVIHLRGVTHGICRCAPDELHDGRSRGHRESAYASRFRDGAIADIGVRILLGETTEI